MHLPSWLLATTASALEQILETQLADGAPGALVFVRANDGHTSGPEGGGQWADERAPWQRHTRLAAWGVGSRDLPTAWVEGQAPGAGVAGEAEVAFLVELKGTDRLFPDFGAGAAGSAGSVGPSVAGGPPDGSDGPDGSDALAPRRGVAVLLLGRRATRVLAYNAEAHALKRLAAALDRTLATAAAPLAAAALTLPAIYPLSSGPALAALAVLSAQPRLSEPALRFRILESAASAEPPFPLRGKPLANPTELTAALVLCPPGESGVGAAFSSEGRLQIFTGRYREASTEMSQRVPAPEKAIEKAIEKEGAAGAAVGVVAQVAHEDVLAVEVDARPTASIGKHGFSGAAMTEPIPLAAPKISPSSSEIEVSSKAPPDLSKLSTIASPAANVLPPPPLASGDALALASEGKVVSYFLVDSPDHKQCPIETSDYCSAAPQGSELIGRSRPPPGKNA